MPNLAAALKEEICRLARKEIKAQTEALKQAVTRHRREIASLKRSAQQQQKKTAYLEAQEGKRVKHPKTLDSPNEAIRFSARSVAAQRKRLGFSAADYAKLIGVSPLTIYNWEHGKSRPRKEQLSALVAVRGIGKREAMAKLEVLEAGQQKAAQQKAAQQKTAKSRGNRRAKK